MITTAPSARSTGRTASLRTLSVLCVLAWVLTWASTALGRELVVTRLDDDPQHPEPGSFRWAVGQPGVSRVTFAKAGDVMLRERVRIRAQGLIIDGSTAPALGVCLRGGSIELIGARDVTLRYLRLRLGDETTRARNRREGLARPRSSAGLDCLSIHECRGILVDHCSLSWSCDELICVTRSRDVTVQYCILSEPLGRPRLHPYGDRHAFCVNASSSKLKLTHCLFSRYCMRGPQFEANDMRRRDRFTVRLAAEHCIMHNYLRSGARYTTGVEDHRDEAKGMRFEFTFLDNLFVDPDDAPAVEAEKKHGRHPGVSLVKRDNLESSRWPAEQRWEMLLSQVGCNHRRDSVDERVIRSVREDRFLAPIQSQRSVGGWPDLSRQNTQPRRLADILFHGDFSSW